MTCRVTLPSVEQVLTLAASQVPAPASSFWKAPCALMTLADPLGSFWAEPAQHS